MRNETTKGNFLGYKDIADEMRRRILHGEWKPGMRIPTKLELCDDFQTSVGTMQRALNLLNSDGFLKPRGCAGTFIREDAPHLHRVGVAFAGDPTASLMWHAIDRELRHLELARGTFVRSYCNCASAGAESDLPQLLDDVQCGRLGALIFASPPAYLTDSAVLQNDRLVRANIGSLLPSQDRSDIEIRLSGVIPAAMEYLQGRNKKKLALICTCSWGGNVRELCNTAVRYGLCTERRLVHLVDQRTPHTCRGIVELIMGLPPSERPDALYVVDDHLVPQSTMGVHDAGIRTGDDGDLEVIAHANFPYPQHTGVPVTFVGYDIRALLSDAVQVISQRLAGNATPSVVNVGAVFQNDLPYDLWDSPAQTPQARLQFEAMGSRA